MCSMYRSGYVFSSHHVHITYRDDVSDKIYPSGKVHIYRGLKNNQAFPSSLSLIDLWLWARQIHKAEDLPLVQWLVMSMSASILLRETT